MSFHVEHLDFDKRVEIIELTNQFFRKVNSMQLDGVFQIRHRAAVKMTDIYLKLSGSEKILLIGALDDTSNELLSLLIARVEEKPYLKEGKVLFIDLAVTKNGAKKRGYMKSLVSYAEKWALQKNIQSIELRAITENSEAVEYWKKRGFTDFYIRFRKNLSKF
ncbi:MAG: GNAT family N-acetyltransferase [Leptospiraceae bacterium]|nr:GNAT family N-acetyltransferase [Leptospiraceae bacterium]NUM41650.1 GNAT family N-acetyltransferase [Leptospiraceae bacterium]